ncbi:MAG: SGNH family hydrolase [Pseudomonadota bacterium]
MDRVLEQQRANRITPAQGDPLGSFFRSIFGGSRRNVRRQREIRRQRQLRRLQRQQREPVVRAVPKDENAHIVTVFGDSLASGLGKGLVEAFAQEPTVRIETKFKSSSGLARDDFFNWPAQITAYLEDETTRTDVAVFLVGINDRQEIPVGDHAFRSDGWVREYEARISQVARLFWERGIPLVWIGVPPMRQESLSSDMLFFNQLYRNQADLAGHRYVDTWLGFVDENGRFARSGPDVTGQIRRLRTDNGIQFTRAGYRKLAFYTERPLRRILGTGNLLALPGDREVPILSPQETGIGPIVSLTGGTPRSVPQLAGGPDDELPKREDSAYHEVLVEGERLPIIAGELQGGDAEEASSDGPSAQPTARAAGTPIPPPAQPQPQ